jgi:predicted dehydrogenase
MLRLGIIGAGAAVRKLHLPVLQQMTDQVRPVAVASQTLEKAETFRELVGDVEVSDDYRTVLAHPKVDAVLIAVPIELNSSILIEAVHAGKHILAEKPIAATIQEARQILEACSRNSQVVAIAENFRYRGDIRKAGQVLATGEIGEVFSFQVNVRIDLSAEVRRVWMERPWRQVPRHPGGLLLDAGVHVVSGLRDILGEIVQLCAEVSDQCPLIQGPDNLLMQIKLKSGAIGHVFACYTAKVEKETIFELIAYGKHGSLRVSDGEVTWITDPKSPPKFFREPDFDRGYRLQWQNFVKAIRGEEILVSTPEEACADLLVIDAALRSAETGQKILLEKTCFPSLKNV